MSRGGFHCDAQPSSLVSGLALVLSSASSLSAATQVVGNCNDSGGSSLRAAVAAAGNGETVDMTQLPCSLITLSSGPLTPSVANLTLKGKGQQALTISGGNHTFGVIQHNGTGTLSISDMKIGYASYAQGGCIATKGSASLARVTLTACKATGTSGLSLGGAIGAVHDITLDACTVSNNDAYDGSFSGGKVFGAGVFAGGNVIVTQSTIHSNHASTSSNTVGGGGIYTLGSLTLTRSTISGNSALDVLGSAAVGGGAGVAGNVTIVASTITGNNASYGGGIAGGTITTTFTVTDSTISDNTAASGGGIVAAAPLHLFNSTVAHNYAGGTSGGGGIVIGANSQMQSSIVADNSTARSPLSDVASAGHTFTVTGANNIIGAAEAKITLPGDTLHVDPMLASFLENNGGPTQTLALKPTSPAINKGNNAASLPYDQRGVAFCRVTGGRADIGAYEVQQGVCDEIFADGFEL